MSASVESQRVTGADRLLFRLGPALALVSAVVCLSVIPFGGTYIFGRSAVSFVIADIDASGLFVLALFSSSAVSFALSAWSVRDVEARISCLRTGAQSLCWLVAMALSFIPMAMIYGTLDLADMAQSQDLQMSVTGILSTLGWAEGSEAWAHVRFPRWGLFLNPLAGALLLLSGMAATRLPPFDRVAGRAENLTGLFAEGSGMRTGNAALADGVHTLVVAGFFVTVCLGGWSIPYLDEPLIVQAIEPFLGVAVATALCALFQVACFATKVALVVSAQTWFAQRVEAPSHERLMRLCFNVAIPFAIIDIFATGWLITRFSGPA